MISNQSTYESHDVVKHYATLNELQKPEREILDQLAPQLSKMKMLDIGVGAGRTASYFAPLTAEYVGIDYSANMITACKSRFGDAYTNTSFAVCDVRFMKAFRDNYFDFILFSYNGIDSMSAEDRLLALKEIKRVLSTSGLFCFSAHNLNSIGNLRTIQPRSVIRMLYGLLVKNPLLTLLNDNFEDLKKRNYSIIRDGTHYFRLKTYYIKPTDQVKQLEALGFKNTKAYGLNGKEIKDLARFEASITDHWIYYLCNA